MNILFLSRWYPVPPDNGSKIRILNLLRSLTGRYKVSLISFVEPTRSRGGSLDLGVYDQVLIPFEGSRAFNPRSLLRLLGSTPRFLVDTRSREMEEAIRRRLCNKKFDLIIASQTWMASYYDCFAGTPSLFEEVELGLFRQTHHTLPRPLRRLRRALTWRKHLRYVRHLIPQFNACTVVSDAERRLLAEAAPDYKPVHVIPNGLNIEEYARVSQPREKGLLVFAGSLTFWPNHEGMSWFLRDVYPIIKFAAPSARVLITGNPGLRSLPPAPDVILTGPVADVRPLLASAEVSICPLRSGGGTRLKVLEAMALRTPVVATPKAVEGLEVTSGRNVLLGNSPSEFADAVLRLLHDPSLARQVAENAFELVRQHYDWQMLEPRWLNVVEQFARVPSGLLGTMPSLPFNEVR